MRKILVTLAAAVMAVALTMGGGAQADPSRSCIGAQSDAEPDYDNTAEKMTHIDVDVSLGDIRRGEFKICGLPDGGD